MTCGDFIGNLEGLNEGGDFPRELLKVGGGGRAEVGGGEAQGIWPPREGRGGGLLHPAPAVRVWALVTQPGDRPLPQPAEGRLPREHAHLQSGVRSGGGETALENT